MTKELRAIEKQIEHLMHRKLMLEMSGDWKHQVMTMIRNQMDALELEKARLAAGYGRV